ncbi:MAG TPA: DNA polymerase III subunit beta [Patescibacteria group bacterium]|nr:DNA polymerase III subunit beta [Patescibacteria group bacterium]
MHLKILQQDLIGPLQSISRSVGVRATLPVLGNILMETGSGKLKLSATNLEVGVIKMVNANILEDGAITVPSKTLNEVISSLQGLEIELQTEGEVLKIKAGKFKADLVGLSSQEFPAIPGSDETGTQIPKEVFKETIPQISFASAVDEGRPVLTGILTEIKDSKFEVVATDGFRLAHKTYANEKLKGINFKALIPRRTLDELVRLIAEEDESFESVGFSTTDNQNQVVFTLGSTVLSSRLIEGNFPSWEKIIPANHVAVAVTDKEELVKGLKLASVFAKGEANVIKLKVSPAGIKLASETKELGNQDDEIEAKVSGQELEVAFNSKYLLDAVSSCPGEQLNIEFSGSLSAARLSPLPGQGLEYIVMPVRIN